MDLIKWQLNWVECNFGLKSYLWFQIELVLHARSILKSRVWFQTKLHSTQFNYHYKYTQFTALYVAIAAFNLLFKLRYSLNIEKKWTKFKDLPFPGPKHNENFTKAAIMKPNEEKCLLSSQPTSLTFIPLFWLARKCGKPLAAAFSRCFRAVFLCHL